MSKRPTDHLQPSGKRRPGEQLTKDNAGDSDEEGPAIEPGTWGKADAATLARRKVVRVRRGGAGAAEPAAAEPAATKQAASANPFAGVSLAAQTAPPPAAANPFAGISLVPAQPAAAAATAAPATDKADAAASKATVDQAEEAKAAKEPATADASKEQAVAAAAPAEVAAKPSEAQEKESQAALETAAVEPTAVPVTAAPAATTDAAAAPAAGTSLFGGSVGGFGGFGAAAAGGGGFGTGGGFGGAGGFGGFAAAAKDGAAVGSLFGSYTAPKPGGFGAVPAFGAGRQSKDGEDDAAADAAEGEGEGNEVFGGDNVPPVVQLSEVPKQTGEEDEETLYTVDGSLFEFADGKQWRERGKGELRLNVNKTTQQARMVMRQRGSQKLLLNARLYPKMATSKMVGGKGVTFATVNAAVAAAAGEGVGSQEATEKDSKQESGGVQPEAGSSAAHVMRTYALKVKNAEKIDEFILAVDQHKAGPSGGDVAAAEDAV